MDLMPIDPPINSKPSMGLIYGMIIFFFYADGILIWQTFLEFNIPIIDSRILAFNVFLIISLSVFCILLLKFRMNLRKSFFSSKNPSLMGILFNFLPMVVSLGWGFFIVFLEIKFFIQRAEIAQKWGGAIDNSFHVISADLLILGLGVALIFLGSAFLVYQIIPNIKNLHQNQPNLKH